MPLLLVSTLIATIVVVISIRVTKKDNLDWLKCKGTDCVVFISTFTALVFSIGILGRIAIYISDYNASVDAIMGGLLMNLALFFVPGLLFIASLILGVRLMRRSPKE